MYIFTCLHANIHTYIYTHTLTHTHTQTHAYVIHDLPLNLQGGEVPPEGLFPFPQWEVRMFFIEMLGLSEGFGNAMM
jgi:hypothetical protein